MNVDKICNLSETIKMNVNSPLCPISPQIVKYMQQCLSSIVEEIDEENHVIFIQLEKIRKNLFYNNVIGMMINPVSAGRLLAILDILYETYTKKTKDIWGYIHPEIIESSKQLYLDGYYNDAAFRAFVTINEILKNKYKSICVNDDSIPDGVNLANKLFSENKPLMMLQEQDRETNENLQKGMRFMLAGAISALRNPSAHSNNIEVSKEEAMRRLMFASMLMYKIDEAVPICEKTN